MGKIISVVLQKGGTAKTTTALALAATLGFKGKKVLLIDFDPQRNATYSSGVDDPEYSITDVLGGDFKAEDAIIKIKYYDLLAADRFLNNVELERVKPDLLAAEIRPIKEKYDYIIIDTPPALGNLSTNALVASDYVLIPIEPRPFALAGLGTLNETIETVRKASNPNLKVLGILLVKYSNRTVLNRDIKGMIEDFVKQMNTIVFETSIREGIAVAEAQTVRQPLIDYAKNSKPNIDYTGLVTEILKMIEGGQ